jgi:hypothetical protein
MFLENATSLIILDHIVKIRAQQSSSCDPSLSKSALASHRLRGSDVKQAKGTHIKHSVFHLTLATQHKQSCEVVRLHNGEAFGVIYSSISYSLKRPGPIAASTYPARCNWDPGSLDQPGQESRLGRRPQHHKSGWQVQQFQ